MPHGAVLFLNELHTSVVLLSLDFPVILSIIEGKKQNKKKTKKNKKTKNKTKKTTKNKNNNNNNKKTAKRGGVLAMRISCAPGVPSSNHASMAQCRQWLKDKVMAELP